MLQMVIAARAELDVRDASGQTALKLAAKRGNVEHCQLLIDAGADAEQLEAREMSSKNLVNWQPHKQDAMLNLIDKQERPRRYGEALILAIRQRDVRSAESAIEAGADVSLIDGGETP